MVVAQSRRQKKVSLLWLLLQYKWRYANINTEMVDMIFRVLSASPSDQLVQDIDELLMVCPISAVRIEAELMNAYARMHTGKDEAFTQG